MKLKDAWIFWPCLLFYHVALTYCSNIPAWDDYDMPLGFIIKYSHAGFWERIQMIFAQNGEHRIIPSKIVYILYWAITGSLNFRTLCLIGDFQLLVVAFGSAYFLRKYSQHWLLLSFLFCLLIFDMNTYENALMCMNALANYGQVAFFVATIWLYDREKTPRWLAGGVQFLCAFSNGNGMVSMLIVVLFNWIGGDKKKTILSAIIGSACLAFNFYFHHTDHLPTAIPFELSRTVVYFIRMTGAPFSFDLSLPYGIVVLVITAILFPIKTFKKNRGIFCLLLFVLETMVLTAIFRANTSDAQFQTSRYLIYPQLLIACTVFYGIQRVKPGLRQLAYSAIVAILCIMYFGNYRFGEIQSNIKNIKANMYPFYYPDTKKAQELAKQACDEGIYCIEENR